ncbi:MAG: DUF4292 domain-containing protein [Bacteroidota bacterium]
MRYLPFLFLLLLVAACKPKTPQSTASGSGVSVLSETELVMRGLIENQFTAEWIDGRANIKLESPDMNVGGTAYIRLERDKQLWVSVKKFGFEAARALIRPDSFFVINRLQNEYTAEPLSYIEEKYKIPARFPLLQQIVMGNPIFMDRNLDLETEEGSYHLMGENSRWASDYWANQETYFLERMKLQEVAKKQTVQVFMDDFRDVGLNRAFSHQREIEVESPSSGLARIKLNFSKIDFNQPVDMPYNIPSRFQRGE